MDIGYVVYYTGSNQFLSGTYLNLNTPRKIQYGLMNDLIIRETPEVRKPSTMLFTSLSLCYYNMFNKAPDFITDEAVIIKTVNHEPEFFEKYYTFQELSDMFNGVIHKDVGVEVVHDKDKTRLRFIINPMTFEVDICLDNNFIMIRYKVFNFPLSSMDYFIEWARHWENIEDVTQKIVKDFKRHNVLGGG